jgi:hypothetical protein
VGEREGGRLINKAGEGTGGSRSGGASDKPGGERWEGRGDKGVKGDRGAGEGQRSANSPGGADVSKEEEGT